MINKFRVGFKPASSTPPPKYARTTDNPAYPGTVRPGNLPLRDSDGNVIEGTTDHAYPGTGRSGDLPLRDADGNAIEGNIAAPYPVNPQNTSGDGNVIDRTAAAPYSANLQNAAGDGIVGFSLEEGADGVITVHGDNAAGESFDISDIATITVTSDNPNVLAVDAPIGMTYKEHPKVDNNAKVTIVVTWNDNSKGPFSFSYAVNITGDPYNYGSRNYASGPNNPASAPYNYTGGPNNPGFASDPNNRAGMSDPNNPGFASDPNNTGNSNNAGFAGDPNNPNPAGAPYNNPSFAGDPNNPNPTGAPYNRVGTGNPYSYAGWVINRGPVLPC